MSVPSRQTSIRAGSARREAFTATHWTQVAMAANQDGSVPARQALEAFCTRYWPAVYSFLRRKNHGPSDAEDLTQGFFAHILENNSIARADPAKGRFRNFLLGALQRYLVDQDRRDGAQKRGRDKVMLAFDFAAVERKYLDETDPNFTPEQVYDRRWATTVLETAFAELEAEFRDADQSDRFDALKLYLSQDVDDGDYQSLSARLGVSSKAVSSAVSRLRERYRESVRRTVLMTVGGVEDVDLEFRELFR